MTRSLPVARTRPCKVASGCKVLTPWGSRYLLVVFFGRVTSCSTANQTSQRQQQQQQHRHGRSEVLEVVQDPRANAARAGRHTRTEVRAQKGNEARAQTSPRRHAAPSKCRKGAATARRRATHPVQPLPVILVCKCCEGFTAVLRCFSRPSTIVVGPPYIFFP